MLKVETQSAPDFITLRCIGRIVLGVEAETLRCLVTSRHERVLVLDLRRVHAIDAAGLGLLVELHHWALESNRLLVIANPSRRVTLLVAMTDLHRVLRLAASVGHYRSSQEEEEPVGRQAMTA